MEKFEFASTPYVEELRRQLEAALQEVDISGVEFCMSEEYTDPPVHLLKPEARSIGFYFRISGGRVEVRDHPRDDADVAIIADYQSILPFVRAEQGPHPHLDEATQAAVSQLISVGKLLIKGDLSARPEVVQRANLHDRLAPLTR